MAQQDKPHYALCLLVVFIRRRVVEGSGVGIAGCGVHVDVYGE